MRVEGVAPQVKDVRCRENDIFAHNLQGPGLCAYWHGLITTKTRMDRIPQGKNQVRQAAAIERRKLNEPLQVLQQQSSAFKGSDESFSWSGDERPNVVFGHISPGL